MWLRIHTNVPVHGVFPYRKLPTMGKVAINRNGSFESIDNLLPSQGENWPSDNRALEAAVYCPCKGNNVFSATARIWGGPTCDGHRQKRDATSALA